MALFVAHPALALMLAAAINIVFAPQLPDSLKQLCKLLLQGSIVFLGLTINVQSLWSVSQHYSVLIAVYVVATMLVGIVLGRFLRADTDQTRLLAAGTAICGGTAIAALGPVIRARAESVAACLTLSLIHI